MTRRTYYPTPLRAGPFTVAGAQHIHGWTVLYHGRPAIHHHDHATGQRRPAFLAHARDALHIAQELARSTAGRRTIS
jgi:hypothetical protein